MVRVFKDALRALAIVVFAAALPSACTSTVREAPPPSVPTANDPFEDFNRAMFSFNRTADKTLIGPAARGYERVVPQPVRRRIGNVVDNFRTPIWFANEVLQGDFPDAANAFDRFLVNSVFGIGGIFDVAAAAGIEKRTEDLGQTFATYHVPRGPYLVLPLLGPSSPRDIVGRVGDFYFHPLSYIEFEGDAALRSSLRVTGALDTRVEQDRALMRIYDSADPYIQLRSLWMQRREADIHEDADPFADLPEFD